MTTQIDSTTRTSWCTTLNTNIGTSAIIRLLTGSPPADCASAQTGTLLATLTGNATAFGSVASGVLTVSAISSVTAGATGTAGYFRVLDSGGTTCHLQGTVATSGGDLNITSTAVSSGDTIAVGTWTITAPGA